ncbi:MAG: hypothetical protein OXH79_01895 [Boseongicola sp.]|nr:hypothetical protein [Boseongicola sp.]
MPSELQERAAAFLASNRVFNRAEFTAALGLQRDPDSQRRLLGEHVAAGRVMRAPRGVYVVARDASRARFVVQDCIIASKLRPDGVLGYHTALELYGISYTALYNRVHLISDGRSETVDLRFQECQVVRPHRTLVEAGRTDFLTIRMERQGVPMKVTAFERTLVDVLHRADRAGGRDEVIECLKFAPYVIDDFDCRKVADYVELLGISSVAGVVGWYLEEWQTELNVSHLTLERLQDMIPGWVPYALRSRPGHSALNRRWRVYLPPDAIDRSFEGTDPDMEF